MVESSPSRDRTGLRDWLIQRVSAVLLGAYSLFILGYLLSNPGLDYGQWKGLFDNTAFLVFTVLALASLLAHAWVGLWIISSDYVPAGVLRILVELAYGSALLGYFVYALRILWAV